MNPPGKALKRGYVHTPSHAAAPAAPAVPAVPATSHPGVKSGAAPVFRILGLLQLAIGLLAIGYGLLTIGSGGHLVFAAGFGCLFWSALMFAISEVLIRLAEISEAVRKQAGE
jgi:hypothetical protein